MKHLKFCPEYQRVYDAHAEKPHLFIAMGWNRMVIKLKKSGIWDKLDKFYPQFHATYYQDTETKKITRELHSGEDGSINWIDP